MNFNTKNVDAPKLYESTEVELSNFIDESKDDIVAKSCKEVLVTKEIWEWRFP